MKLGLLDRIRVTVITSLIPTLHEGVDVHDDYISEKAQCEKHGKKLNQNQYIGKCILGPKFPKYDSMDEKDKVAGCACVLS